jgi:hypothetical protein
MNLVWGARIIYAGFFVFLAGSLRKLGKAAFRIHRFDHLQPDRHPLPLARSLASSAWGLQGR